MTAIDRENLVYAKGKINPIDLEERIMFSFLPKPEGQILDIGCGVGNITKKIQSLGFSVNGVDFSEEAIKKAMTRIPAKCWDLDKGIPFNNNSFDIVWAGDVIEHVFDPIGLLEEINRVLKKDGHLFLSVPNDFNIYKRINVIFSGKSIQSNLYRRRKQCKHHTYFSLELLEYMLSQNNFLIDSFYAIWKMPMLHKFFNIEKKRVTKVKKIGELFGNTFILNTIKIQPAHAPEQA